MLDPPLVENKGNAFLLLLVDGKYIDLTASVY